MSPGNSHLYGLVFTVVGIIIVSLLFLQTSLPKTIHCAPPTLLYEGTCCLDENSNAICDFLETEESSPAQPSTIVQETADPVRFGPRTTTRQFIVTRVLNAETFEAGGVTVRLSGIDAPVRGEYGSYAATNHLRSLIEGKNVEIEGEGYVFFNGSVNARMVRAGYATALLNTPYATQLRAAEDIARREKIGIWTSPEEREAVACDERCLSVYYLNYESPFQDDCVVPNDEFVTFENNCGHTCELSAWTLRDEGIARYVFPQFSLRSGERVTVFSGAGANSDEYLFWNNKGSTCDAVWDNTGDTIYLRNQDGEVVLTHKYQGRVLG